YRVGRWIYTETNLSWRNCVVSTRGSTERVVAVGIGKSELSLRTSQCHGCTNERSPAFKHNDLSTNGVKRSCTRGDCEVRNLARVEIRKSLRRRCCCKTRFSCRDGKRPTRNQI